ncbi:MAG: hypothetical protein HYT70_03740 [Candidatus Aenigmarchaeota archaeon]|nr:hypothetical protein [Candidatus Aenigmarchaeota archaeon]
MLVVRHRVNKIADLRQVEPKYGVEIDVRHDNRTGRLYLNHDPGTGDDFEDYMEVFASQGNRFVIFNIKEAGIEARVIEVAKRLGIEDYFLLDVEFPFIYRAAFGDGVSGLDGRIAIRYSEAEPIEQALMLAGRLKWVWVDTNTRLPLDKENYRKLKEAGFKLALVCPERWGRPQNIPKFIEQMKGDGVMVDAVMTAKDYVKQWEESGILTSSGN